MASMAKHNAFGSSANSRACAGISLRACLNWSFSD
ncbi:hypothetical protein AB205_0066280 [Aquarana catesbeiana]|uniref:Uncharacterized protein n=1 Tax=Aquarana catesbeiana TaxID=8400 RepID=A0A2G9RHC1_AQUCT|nr:hypothetical protein AB205_0066280 [Aquarana catesbeiana]